MNSSSRPLIVRWGCPGDGIAPLPPKGAGESSRRRNWRVRRRLKNCTKVLNTCIACGYENSLTTSERPKAKAPRAQPEAAQADQAEATNPAGGESPHLETAKPAEAEAGRRFSFSNPVVQPKVGSSAQRLAQVADQHALDQVCLCVS